ncbi:MAG: apolipoprotein N-acyltransferase [Armatimonadota bacterium]
MNNPTALPQDTMAGQASTRTRARDVILNIALVVLSGLLTSLVFLPKEFWWLAPVCLTPLLIALGRTKAIRASGWLALLFGLVLCALSLSWMFAIFGAGSIGVYIFASLPWILFGLAYRVMAGRLTSLAVALLAPVVWVAAEWLRCEGWYFKFSWLQLGSGLTPWPSGAALFPIIGIYGATFFLLLLNALLAGLITSGKGRRRPFAVALAAGGVVLALLGMRGDAGVPVDNGRRVHVTIVQHESGDLATLKQLSKPTMEAGVPGLIVWPEYALQAYPLDDEKLLQELRDVARRTDCTLVLGCKKSAPDDAPCDGMRRRGMLAADGRLFYNIALVIGPDGTVLGDYAKANPVQFFSDGVPGRAFPLFDTPAGRFGIGICYDFDYATTNRRLARQGAELLVIPTFDSIEWTDLQHRQHARLAQARAAEVGLWVARATSSGVSQIIDPQGRERKIIPTGDSSAVNGVVYARSNMTVYTRFSYLLPYVCLALAIMLLAALLFRRKTVQPLRG